MSITQSWVFGPLLFISLFIPLYAHASVFSFLSNFFSSGADSTLVNKPNSQTMALLEATHSPGPQALASDSGNFSIEDDNSLVPQPPAAAATTDHISGSDQISIYVVHKGDTLPAIAKMFGVTVNTIKWGNNLTSNTLTVGQTLVILPISGVEHIVKAGDTLQSIAKLHKGDMNEIMQYNNLTKDSKLAVGDIIIIPDGEAAPSQTGDSSKAPKNNAGVGTVGPSTELTIGYYMRPIIGGVKTQGIHGHNAVDLASAYGSSILAAADGDVIVSRDSGWNGGYGSYIVLKHANGTQTLYGHLSATLVEVGDHVTQGQVIGRMGSTGDSTGTHLHFEIRGAPNPF